LLIFGGFATKRHESENELLKSLFFIALSKCWAGGALLVSSSIGLIYCRLPFGYILFEVGGGIQILVAWGVIFTLAFKISRSDLNFAGELDFANLGQWMTNLGLFGSISFDLSPLDI